MILQLKPLFVIVCINLHMFNEIVSIFYIAYHLTRPGCILLRQIHILGEEGHRNSPPAPCLHPS